MRGETLLAEACEDGVTFVSGSEFYLDAGGEEAVRLAFSYATTAEIEEGIARLGRLVREESPVPA
jgi:DNA-binding transcriptional MocR family regulator